MHDPKKLKIFILEDNPHRMVWFNNDLEKNIRHVGRQFNKDGHDDVKIQIYHAEDVESAEKLWKKEQPFDAYFLDHDLGGEVMVDSSEDNTGYSFGLFLCDQGINGLNEQIFVHSLNPVGAENIKNLFYNAKIVRLFNF